MYTTVQPVISDRRRLGEIVAVFLTGIGKLLFMFPSRLVFVLTVCVFWLSYILYRYWNDKELFHYWGFRTDNFKEAFLKVYPFGLVAVVSCFLVGGWFGTINMTWHLIPILILYPIWGILQQFLIIGLVAGNLKDFKNRKFKDPVIIVVAAILFAGVHYPYYWLILGTFVLALYYSYVYLKIRNLYVLGLFHGWLGGLFFYTVVNRDPFVEMFGGFLK
jgi:uncharacterized protein